MSNMYETEVYNYLSKPANFLAAREINRHFDAVCDRIFKEFWGMVYKKLEVLSQEKDFVLDPARPASFVERYASIHIRPKEDFAVRVAVSDLTTKPFFGLSINKDDTRLDRAQVKAYLAQEAVKFANKTPTDWWYGRDAPVRNFFEDGDMERILPENRAAEVDNMANEIVQFYEANLKHLEKMNGKRS